MLIANLSLDFFQQNSTHTSIQNVKNGLITRRWEKKAQAFAVEWCKIVAILHHGSIYVHFFCFTWFGF